MTLKNEIARRYAAAFFEAAKFANSLEECFEDVKAINDAVNTAPELFEILFSPFTKFAVKRAALRKTFEGRVNILTFRLLLLLVERNRISLLQEICKEFIRQKNSSEGIVNAKFYSAIEIVEQEKLSIQGKLEERFSKKFIIDYYTDPGLIAGFRFFFNDEVFDSSAATMLESLRKQFIKG